MEKRRRTNDGFHIPCFYVIYLAVTITVILIVIIALGIVRARLAEYESAQPKYVAADVFEKYFEPIDYIALLTDAHYDAAGEAAIEDLVDYLSDEIGGEQLTYSVGSSNSPDEIKYMVKAGSKQLGAIALKTSDQKTEHGFQTYEFSYIELYLNTEAYLDELARIVVTVDVPSAYSVTVDGEPLTEELVTDVYARTDVIKYYPPDVSEIEYKVYTIDTLYELPKEIAVTDPEGLPAEVSLDENTYTYTCGLVYSEALEEEYSDFVINAMEGYAAYVQNAKNVGLNNIRGYFDTGSDAYADVVAAGGSRWMVLDWSGIDFEDVNVDEFYIHTPEIFSCHISLTQLLHQAGQEDFVDVIDMYVFLHLTDQGYKIYDWFNA